MNSSTGLSDKWKKAAIIGGLWASIEIVIGSFLHNMRIPFAGTILAVQGIIILLAFTSFWQERGIIIRAGIITALMKSISPSAVILGPMTGILTEALLLEIFIIVLGRNLFAYMIASAIALSSALIHKIITFIILYGLDIVSIYDNIYSWFQNKLGYSGISSSEFILLIFFLYLSWGIIAGFLGYYIGKKAKSIKLSKSFEDDENQTDDLFFPVNKNQKFNMLLLLLHLISVPTGLLLLNMVHKWSGLVFMLVYILMAFLLYKASMRRLKKPVFWVQLIIIILLASIFGESNQQNLVRLSTEGFISGLELSFRALFVVISFTALSVELRNPKIQNYLNGKFIRSLYEALSISFAVLPRVVKSLPHTKELLFRPLNTFSLLVAKAKFDYEKSFSSKKPY
jgi:hypothetical protein